LHPEMKWAKCVYWMYSILIGDEAKVSRDDLMRKLEENGIETRLFFTPMHLLPIYSDNSKYPVAEKLAKSGINLPSNVNLNSEIIFICDVISRWFL